ncbi:MAG TPA: hypothetical protein VNG90_01760 [Candidatus Acidoferrum sp.]|nr:hypothetical protein [Candidatus Acidoferrum sp.]
MPGFSINFGKVEVGRQLREVLDGLKEVGLEYLEDEDGNLTVEFPPSVGVIVQGDVLRYRFEGRGDLVYSNDGSLKFELILRPSLQEVRLSFKMSSNRFRELLEVMPPDAACTVSREDLNALRFVHAVFVIPEGNKSVILNLAHGKHPHEHIALFWRGDLILHVELLGY